MRRQRTLVGWDREGRLSLVFHRLYERAEGKSERGKATGLGRIIALINY
jgi:hypothetical protein